MSQNKIFRQKKNINIEITHLSHCLSKTIFVAKIRRCINNQKNAEIFFFSPKGVNKFVHKNSLRGVNKFVKKIGTVKWVR